MHLESQSVSTGTKFGAYPVVLYSTPVTVRTPCRQQNSNVPNFVHPTTNVTENANYPRCSHKRKASVSGCKDHVGVLPNANEDQSTMEDTPVKTTSNIRLDDKQKTLHKRASCMGRFETSAIGDGLVDGAPVAETAYSPTEGTSPRPSAPHISVTYPKLFAALLS